MLSVTVHILVYSLFLSVINFQLISTSEISFSVSSKEQLMWNIFRAQKPPYVDMSPPAKLSSCRDASRADDLILVLFHHDYSWKSTHTYTHSSSPAKAFYSLVPAFRQVLLLFVGAFGSSLLDCSIAQHLNLFDTSSYVLLVVCCKPDSQGQTVPLEGLSVWTRSLKML